LSRRGGRRGLLLAGDRRETADSATFAGRGKLKAAFFYGREKDPAKLLKRGFLAISGRAMLVPRGRTQEMQNLLPGKWEE